MADEGPQRTEGDGSGRFMPRSPDPTAASAAAVEAATEVSRREIQALREKIETRLAGADEDRGRIWERLRDLPSLYETYTVHLREELLRQDRHDREVLTQRLDDLDSARKRDQDQLAAELEHRSNEYGAARAALQGLLEQRMAGTDRAVELMAEETARSLTTADAGDERIRAEMHALVTALQELIEQRLGAMDLATKVLAGSVEKFPSDIDRAIGNLREVVLGEVKRVQSVTEEKFTAIDGTFSSNALALTAALAAQKEAAAEQNKSNTLAITKSESSTKETIAANAVQAQTGLASLSGQVTDVKERVVRIESAGVGATSVTGSPFDAAVLAQEARIAQDARQRAALAIVISAILALAAISSLVFAIVKKLQRVVPCCRW